MVSKKVVMVVLVVAILLSIVSIVVTISSVNMKKIPEISLEEQTSDNSQGQISLIINPPSNPLEVSEDENK